MDTLMHQNSHQECQFSNCKQCQAAVPIVTQYQKARLKTPGWVFCGPECSTKYRAAISSATMAMTNKKYASDRMKARNPMRMIDARQKMRATLIAMGHKPVVRGGNGQGMTDAQAAILFKLRESHPDAAAEHIVPVKKGRGNGYPTHYKIDVAIPSKMIAIEVDGLSHCSIDRQQQDRKKDDLLTSLGWRVFRFTNRQVAENLEICCRTVLSTTSR